jgi:methionyl aminopeptidase
MTAQGARIVIKSPREIELLRAAGRVVYRVLDELERMVRPGATTAELDARAEELIRAVGGVPLFKGVKNGQARMPFPASICASVNEQVVHGIPSGRPLREGDIVSVDCGVKLSGYCGDAARTFAVGRLKPEVDRLLATTRDALALAIEETRPGRSWSEIARLIQKRVESEGFSVVRDFVGHGIGQTMHEPPNVPNYVDRKSKHADFELRPGMTLAIEPMVIAGRRDVTYGDATRWPVVTEDGSWAAHFEHTVAVTADGVDVLTDGR